VRKIVTLHLQPNPRPDVEILSVLGQRIELTHIDCHGNLETVADHIREYDGLVQAIAIVGATKSLQLGSERVAHFAKDQLFSIATKTPVVDGSGITNTVERWAIRLVSEMEPGIWSQKNVLMAPGLNHTGMAEALQTYAKGIRYADPILYFDLPAIGRQEPLTVVSDTTLNQLKDYPYSQLYPTEKPYTPHDNNRHFNWANVIAGDIHTILRYAPTDLSGKTAVVSHVSDEQAKILHNRKLSILITLLPNLSHDKHKFAHHHSATVEACLATLHEEEKDQFDQPDEDRYLTLLADLHWQPTIRYLQPEEARLSKFAYVTQPADANHLRQTYRWTNYVPQSLLTRTAAHIPPVFAGRVRKIVSKRTDQTAEASLLMLGGTPQEFAQRETNFVYRRLLRAARMAEQLGARLMGVSAFSDKMGEASELVSHKTGIAITSGRTLTAASAIEAAQAAVLQLGHGTDLRDIRVTVVEATRPSMVACARYIAPRCPQLTLVADRPEQLIALKKQIEQESPNAKIALSTSTTDPISDAHLIFAVKPEGETDQERPFELARCQPGAVICDFSRPTTFPKAEAELRPDLLIIHAGKFRMPGEPQFEFNFGLPDGLIHPSFVEAAVLALEERFQDFTVGNELTVEKLREIITLTYQHGIMLDGLRSYDKILTETDIEAIRQKAEELRQSELDMGQLVRDNRQALQALEKSTMLPQLSRGNGTLVVAGLGVFAVVAGIVGWFFTRRGDKQEQ